MPAHVLLDEIVDLGADPADDLAVALASHSCARACSNQGFLPGSMQAVDLVLQRRDPSGVVLVDLPGEVDEGLRSAFCFDRADGDGCLLMAVAASG